MKCAPCMNADLVFEGFADLFFEIKELFVFIVAILAVSVDNVIVIDLLYTVLVDVWAMGVYIVLAISVDKVVVIVVFYTIIVDI